MRLPIEMIGNKIRSIRKEKGFTLENMASKTGLSKGLLSQVERGISQPSLDSLWKITKALESSMVHFFEEIDQKHVHVIRKQKRRQLLFPDSNGTVSLLSAGGNAKLATLEIRLQPGEMVKETIVQAEGEECLVMISGSVTVRLGEEEYLLEEGDSLYLASTQTHQLENTGDCEAIIIWSVTPPQL
ncbi:MAG: helix-turn-helix domain-containing protein [Clostridia bacterium]